MTDIDDISRMTLEQTRTAAKALLDGIDGDLTGPAAERFQQLTARAEQIREQQRQRDEQLRDMNTGIASGKYKLMGERDRIDPYGTNRDEQPPAQSQRDTAMRTIERAVKANKLAVGGAELVETLMRTGSPLAQTWTQRYAATAGSEHYERAFSKLVANPTQGHLEWTPEEADAYRAVAAVQAEQRAMNIGDTSGGYMIPLTLDPSIMLTSNGSTNPLRQIARTATTVTDTWQGVTSAGVTAEWTAEAAEMADASPTLGGPSIPVYKGDAFVPFSFEIGGDAVNFMNELGGLLVDAAEQLNATAFTTGTGTGQPKGVITALTGGSSVVNSGTAATLAASDVYAVQNALPPRFQAGAQWCASLGILNTLRQFETGSGALKFPGLHDNPPTLLGRNALELSNMAATTTTGSKALLYGDFKSGYVIVDRLGSTLELVPHLVGANRRPTGQRGALLWYRVGADVVVPNAFRMLNIA